MFFKAKFAVFAAALCGSVAISGDASAVTFEDLDIIGGDLFLVNDAASTVTTSGVAGSLVIEDWLEFNAETYADTAPPDGILYDPDDYVGPSVAVGGVFDSSGPGSSDALIGLEVYVVAPGDDNWGAFETYLSGNLIETRQVGLRVMEGLFLRTDDRTVPNFGDYLIIRFTTSTDLGAAGTYGSNDIKVYGAVETVTGIPLPGTALLMVSGIGGLAGLRRRSKRVVDC